MLKNFNVYKKENAKTVSSNIYFELFNVVIDKECISYKEQVPTTLVITHLSRKVLMKIIKQPIFLDSSCFYLSRSMAY